MAKKTKAKQKPEPQPQPTRPQAVTSPAPPPPASPVLSVPEPPSLAPPPAPSPVPSSPAQPSAASIPSFFPHSPSANPSPVPTPSATSVYLPPPELANKPPSFLATPRIVTIAEEDEEAEYDDRYIEYSDKDGRRPLSSDLLYEPPYQEDWALNTNNGDANSSQAGYDTHDAHDAHEHDNWGAVPSMSPPPAPAPVPLASNPYQAKIDRFGPSDEVAAAAARMVSAPMISASAVAGGRGQAMSTGRTTSAGWADTASVHTTNVPVQHQAGATEAPANWRPTINPSTWEQEAAKLAQKSKHRNSRGSHFGGSDGRGRGDAPVNSNPWPQSGHGWGHAAAEPMPAQMPPPAPQPGAWRSWGRPATAASSVPPPPPVPPPAPAAPPPPVPFHNAQAHANTWGQQPRQNNWGNEGDYDDEDDEDTEDYDEEDDDWHQDDHQGWGQPSNAWQGQHRRTQSDWTGGKQSDRGHKVTFADGGSEGTRNVLSPHQRSQILNSLLNKSTQNNYVTQNATYGYNPQMQPQKKDRQSKRHSAQDAWGAGGWGNERSDPAAAWGANPAADWGAGGQTTSNAWGDGVGGGGWGAAPKHPPKEAKAKKTGPHGGQSHGQSWGAPADASSAWGQPTSQNADAWGQPVEGWKAGGDWGDPEDDEDAAVEGDRRVHFSPPSTSATSWGGNRVASGYSMPSKTFMHAFNGTATTLTTAPPPTDMFNYPNFSFADSKHEAIDSVKDALFGRKRFAKDRIHWQFPPDKDQRVAQVLEWIQKMHYNLGEFGLHQFLQSRERGALVTNAAYRAPNKPNEPAFDWLTFDQLQGTMDKTIQTSVAFYDPSTQVIIFIFLPSKTGNSVAMWRRKIRVPNNARLSLQPELSMALAGLRKDKDYFVHVDELPRPKSKEVKSPPVVATLQPPKKKKKVRWWNPFEW